MILTRKIARGYKGLVEINLEYDSETRKILGITTVNNSKKALKPQIGLCVENEKSEKDISDITSFKKDLYMVKDKEFGDLVPPEGFEIELNIPFA